MITSDIILEKNGFNQSKFQASISSLNRSLQKQIISRPTYTILNKESAIAPELSQHIQKQDRESIKVPKEFNGPILWKDYLVPPKNQGNCGGCWSFASSGVLTDRYNLLTRNSPRLDLSPLRPIVCNIDAFNTYLYYQTPIEVLEEAETRGILSASCYGNTLLNAFRFLHVFGTTTNECNPYDASGPFYRPLTRFESDKDIPLCETISSTTKDMCSDYQMDIAIGRVYGTPARFFRFKVIYSVPNNEEAIKEEIYKWGPVATGFTVYPDFYEFDPKKEIYKWNGQGEEVGGHAVEIVGWGEENGVKFWWIKNSWGEEWAIGGYFKFYRGENNCQIEENVYAGIPGMFNLLDLYFQERFKNTNIIDSDKTLRNQIDLGGEGIVFGGIDPYTGFTRRALNYYPDLPRDNIFNIENLDIKNYIAGEVTSNIDDSISVSSLQKGIPKVTDPYKNDLPSLYFLPFLVGMYTGFIELPLLAILYVLFNIILLIGDLKGQILFLFAGIFVGWYLRKLFGFKN